MAKLKPFGGAILVLVSQNRLLQRGMVRADSQPAIPRLAVYLVGRTCGCMWPLTQAPSPKLYLTLSSIATSSSVSTRYMLDIAITKRIISGHINPRLRKWKALSIQQRKARH
jgi:hypothetical protein